MGPRANNGTRQAQIVYAVPLGHPAGSFGPVTRKALSEVASMGRWGRSVPPSW